MADNKKHFLIIYTQKLTPEKENKETEETEPEPVTESVRFNRMDKLTKEAVDILKGIVAQYAPKNPIEMLTPSQISMMSDFEKEAAQELEVRKWMSFMQSEAEILEEIQKTEDTVRRLRETTMKTT